MLTNAPSVPLCDSPAGAQELPQAILPFLIYISPRLGRVEKRLKSIGGAAVAGTMLIISWLCPLSCFAFPCPAIYYPRRFHLLLLHILPTQQEVLRILTTQFDRENR